MKRMSVFLFLLFLLLPMQGQDRRFRLVEWNVENLFDTIHDAGHEDFQFLPQGEYQWNTPRYFYKLSTLARTLAALGGTMPADLVAVCEVENDTVLTHLTRRSLLARLGYEYVMTDSPDQRGIDVALLYQPLSFRPNDTTYLRVPYDSTSQRPTRDILYVSGEAVTGDTLHIFVCHLPSRRGGREVTEPYRMRAAGLIRHKVDSLFADNADARIIITGDFNDEPHNAVFKDVLRAHYGPEAGEAVADTTLYMLSARLKAEPDISGTYKYRHQWNRLDQILVSSALLRPSSTSLHTAEEHCAIGALPHLIEPDGERFGMKPKHTYLGPTWHGGTSDHLPLTLDFFY